MHKDVSDTSCAACGTPLLGSEYAESAGEERTPCPNCGSTIRHFGTAVGGVNLGSQTIFVPTIDVSQAITQIAEAEPGDVQQIASGQIKLLASYYDTALAQAQRSFTLARWAAVVGLAFFLLAVGWLIFTRFEPVATVSVISGALVEVVAGINFVLYSRATTQLAAYHERLDLTQRFLLANSICEALEGDAKQTARASLVGTIANQPPPSSSP